MKSLDNGPALPFAVVVGLVVEFDPICLFEIERSVVAKGEVM